MEYRILSAEPDQFQKMLDFIFSKLRGESIVVKELEMENKTQTYDERRFSDEAFDTTDKRLVYELRLVCEEIFINIVSYAYPHSTGEIKVGCDVADNNLVIQTIDAGIPFNPLVEDEPDIESEIETRDIGGLGIFLVRNLMDKITYQRIDDTNILTMEKRVWNF